MTTTLVLGIGNTLLSDEGIGIHVLRHLEPRVRQQEDEVTLLDGGTLSFSLVARIAEHRSLVVVDAAELGAEPGRVACFEGSAMDRFLGTRKRSAHEVGLLDLMDMARLTDDLPSQRALVAVQPASVDWGTQPTDAVAAAIPRAGQAVLDLLRRWRGGTRRRTAS